VRDPCSYNSECYAVSHRAQCRCRIGFRGQPPYDRCIIIECQSNSECPNNRACINEKCVSPCTVQNPCAPSNSDCVDRDHSASCQCRVGYVGNPFISCDPPERQVECVTDGDCPSQLACLNERCQNPCVTLSPCQRPGECRVVDTVPVRTMVCQCPPGYVSLTNGACRLQPGIPRTGCKADSECNEQEACYNGLCRNPCDCGPNSHCVVKFHQPICSCERDYDGDPKYGCFPGTGHIILHHKSNSAQF